MYLSLLIKFAVGLLGMSMVIYGKFLTTPEAGKFNLTLFWKENKGAFILTVIGLVLIPLSVTIVPEAADIIQKLLGLDLDLSNQERGSAFTLGMVLYATIRNLNKSKR